MYRYNTDVTAYFTLTVRRTLVLAAKDTNLAEREILRRFEEEDMNEILADADAEIVRVEAEIISVEFIGPNLKNTLVPPIDTVLQPALRDMATALGYTYFVYQGTVYTTNPEEGVSSETKWKYENRTFYDGEIVPAQKVSDSS